MKRCLIFLLVTFLLICATGCSSQTTHLEGKPWVNPELPGNLPSEKPSVEEDFYLNVNYDLHKQANTSPGSVESVGVNTDKKVQEEVWNVVNTADNLAAKSLKIITSLIMDGERRKAEGREPLMEYVRRIQATKTTEELSRLCREEGMLIGMPYAIVQLEYTLMVPDKFSITLYVQPVVPQLEVQDDEPQPSAGEQLDTKRVEEELVQLGYDADTAKKLTERLVEYQNKINPETTDPNDYSGNGAVSGADIKTVCTPLYDQLVSFGLVTSDNEAEPVFQTVDYACFREIQKQYTEENLDLFQAIICLSLSRYATDYLDPAGYAAAHGIEGEPNLKEAAFEFMRMPAMYITEQAYADARITSEMRTEINGILEEYREAAVKYMEQCDWLSEESRKNAVEKIQKMKMILVTPEREIDYEPLLKALSVENINLLQAVIQHDLMRWKIHGELAGKPYDRAQWTSSRLTMVNTNAVYEPSKNAVLVMMGILQPEFYNRTSRETLLATIGQTISHEMSHGFDSNGIKWDAEGMSVNILTQEDQQKYDEKLQRLINNLSSIELTDDLKVDGNRNRDEEIADLLALRLTLDLAKKTEGFDYDLFYRTLAGKFFRYFRSRDEAMGWYASDPHPAYYIRINYTFGQFEEFYQNYPSINEGTPMYYAPENRESLW